MIILYVFLIAYILSINFYAFMLVKQLRDKDNEQDVQRQAMPLSTSSNNSTAPTPPPQPQRVLGKLLTTGVLGGAITIYACMFIFKWRRTELLLMVLLPLLGVLNVYIFVLLFRSGFGFLLIR